MASFKDACSKLLLLPHVHLRVVIIAMPSMLLFSAFHSVLFLGKIIIFSVPHYHVEIIALNVRSGSYYDIVGIHSVFVDSFLCVCIYF